MIHLDTHVLNWLSGGRPNQLSAKARTLIERESVCISPMVVLELETLFECGKTKRDPSVTLRTLESAMDLAISQTAFSTVVQAARAFAWTRDPFDRLIVANAISDGVRLVTADETILKNFRDAVW